MKIITPDIRNIRLCAEVYISAYKAEPWNEVYKKSDVERYISDYLCSNTKLCFAAVEKEKIIGIAFCIIVPCIGAPFMRIEDFCIAGDEQGKGFGSEFMRLVLEEAKNLGCDSILLETQKNYPSHKFYLKNNFLEINSVLLYKKL